MHSSRFPLSRLAACVLAAAVLVPPAFGRSKIFTLSDPRGDDHGDGNLIYPLNEDLNPGDLDLLSLTAWADRDGTWFEAVFAKPVRQPGAQAVDELGTSLKSLARFGFYTINLDIYIDTDHVPGSGGVAMLPGRLAEIDRASAWEKAIIVTPRPHAARGELKRILMRNLNEESRQDDSTMTDQEEAALKAQIPGDVDDRIFFPNQIRVLGNKLSFFVPASFLGGPAKDTWSYVVAVSGSDLLQAFDANRALGRPATKEDSLNILPISPGTWQDRFGGGREHAANQPPLVDIIVPQAGRPQESVLQDFDAHSKRPVILPGVIPAAEKKK
jgi:C-terminal binding-module, SLH-like, of glucodextranase